MYAFTGACGGLCASVGQAEQPTVLWRGCPPLHIARVQTGSTRASRACPLLLLAGGDAVSEATLFFSTEMCPLEGLPIGPKHSSCRSYSRPQEMTPRTLWAALGTPSQSPHSLSRTDMPCRAGTQHSGLGASFAQTYCVPSSCPQLLCCSLISAQVGGLRLARRPGSLSRGLGLRTTDHMNTSMACAKCCLGARPSS